MPLLAAAQTIEITLTPSNYNGYNISCFGMKDGAINATVTGGTAPYEFKWSNGQETEDITGLPSGYYKLEIKDSGVQIGEAEITLEEPLSMTVSAEAFSYPNGMNISCYDCFNGSINVTVENGVTPYVYAWDDGPTTQDRPNLGEGNYRVVVTDANGCESIDRTLYLDGPERSDWTMSGNANTNPATQYIGTSDAQDVVFKSNDTEALRLKNNGGEVQLPSLAATGDRSVYADENGVLKAGGPSWGMSMNPWYIGGNYNVPPTVNRIGPMNAVDFVFITAATEHMRITADGKVGIGTVPPTESGYRLFVEDGIATRDVLVRLVGWPDYVFDDGYRLMPLAELRAFLKQHKHLPGIPAAAALEAQGGVALGEMQRDIVRTVEEQALYILELEERLERMERRLATLEATR